MLVHSQPTQHPFANLCCRFDDVPRSFGCLYIHNPHINLMMFRAHALSFQCCAQAWDSAAAVARAFVIGPTESQAVSNLQTHVSAAILERLQCAVRLRGLRGFLTHEALAKGLFNRGWTSGAGELEAWRTQLCNVEDDQLVSCALNCAMFSLFLDRGWFIPGSSLDFGNTFHFLCQRCCYILIILFLGSLTCSFLAPSVETYCRFH